MGTADDANTPDYDRMGAAFDVFLPYIGPVADALFTHLPALQAGATVLDLACGTGEPGLSLVKRSPRIRLLGLDAAQGMIAVARRKAVDEGVDASFETAPNEALTIGDASVDAAISRFGLLMFGDPAASARELARVLKPGAAFSIAVWETGSANTFFRVVLEALDRQGQPGGTPRLDLFDALAAPGRREGCLRDAGLGQVDSELFHWRYDYPDLDTAWEVVVASGMHAKLLAEMDDARLQETRQRFADLLAPYKSATGAYSVPQTCRLLWGAR